MRNMLNYLIILIFLWWRVGRYTARMSRMLGILRMHRILIVMTITLVSGCTATLHGRQTVSGGTSMTAVGSSVRGSAQMGHARVSAAFGSPPAPGATGGQVSLSSGGTAVVLVGVLIVHAVNAVGDWFSPTTTRADLPASRPAAQRDATH